MCEAEPCGGPQHPLDSPELLLTELRGFLRDNGV